MIEDKITAISQNVEAVALVSLQTESCANIFPTKVNDTSLVDRPAGLYARGPLQPGGHNDLVTSPNPSHGPFRQSQGEVSCARPNLLTFCSPPGLSQSWDDTEAFYDDELAAGDTIARQIADLHYRDIDLSRKTLKSLQQSFVENFLRWLPICDVQDLTSHVSIASENQFNYLGVSSCFALFAFAIGAVAQAGHHNGNARYAGMEYFAKGTRMLEEILGKENQVEVMQCRILQAAYFQLCIRPLQAWDAIGYVARDLMHLLSSSRTKSWDRRHQAILQRVFWACSIIMHELEAVLKMHPTGLRFYHDFVPLPLTEQEDVSFYYFLAQASLRKLLMDTLDVVGYKLGQVIHAPAITSELRNGVQEWHNHLPPAIRFPIDDRPLFDLRKSFLRCQYVALFVLMGWPSLLRILERGDTSAEAQERIPIVDKEQAAECIRSCVLLLASAEETLACLNLGSQLVLWACYASLIELILTYKVPCLAFIPETQTAEYIYNGYEMMVAWNHLPVIKRGMERARELMIGAELAVPEI